MLAVLLPGQQAVSEAREKALGWVGRTTDSRADEYRRIKAENEQLQASNKMLSDKVSHLQDLLRLERRFPSSLAAHLVSLGGGDFEQSATINRGARDGVHPKNIVVTPAGVVGQITSMIGPYSSVALFLTDPASSVDVRIRRSQVVGVARGDGSSTLTLTYLDKAADVKKGDDVFTSGLGGTFPAGYFVGRVIDVKTDVSGAGRTAKILPAADFSRLDGVLVLRPSPGE
jgi:rod shape-determining protein MreC